MITVIATSKLKQHRLHKNICLTVIIDCMQWGARSGLMKREPARPPFAGERLRVRLCENWNQWRYSVRMTKSCCVFECKKSTKKGKGLHFYQIPTEKCRRIAWIAAINRKNWSPTQTSYVCSAHFISGKRAMLHHNSSVYCVVFSCM